jgi:hypothetical protein
MVVMASLLLKRLLGAEELEAGEHDGPHGRDGDDHAADESSLLLLLRPDFLDHGGEGV